MINFDMDGVVADFDSAIVKLFGSDHLGKVPDEFWRKTCVEKEVFRHMDTIYEGMGLFNRLRLLGYDLCFATSTGGMPHHIDIAKQKLDWLHAHGLGMFPVKFCMNTEGKGQMASPGEILIDDRQKVCDAWQRQGGIAYLFTPEDAPDIYDNIRKHFTPSQLNR